MKYYLVLNAYFIFGHVITKLLSPLFKENLSKECIGIHNIDRINKIYQPNNNRKQRFKFLLRGKWLMRPDLCLV